MAEGRTRDQIEWIQDHKAYSENVELRFSDPATFFAAVKRQRASLPVIVGELNPHAVGCYSVVRDIKREGRRAETMLLQAEAMARQTGAIRNLAVASRLEEAWRTALLQPVSRHPGGQFDQAGLPQRLEELGGVKSLARDLIVQWTRQANAKLSPCARQRIVMDNPGMNDWEGPVEFGPWFQTDGLPQHFALLDGKGSLVPFQPILAPHLRESPEHRPLRG